VERWIRRALLHPQIQSSWTLIAAAVIIVGICYANSLPNGFILDDYPIVAVNPAIRAISPVHFLKTPYWGASSNSGIYRPLTIFSFSLEYPLWQQWAGGYRLTNLLLHSINGVLVFLLSRSILQSVPAAAAAAAVYLMHPVHTEPVVGLAGRSELLATLFFLLAWIFFRQRRTNWCAAAFFFSLLSKENAIVFPAVLVLDAFLTEGGVCDRPRTVISRGSALSRLRFAERVYGNRFAAVIGVAAFYLALRILVLGGLGVPKTVQYLDGTLTLAQRELTSGRAFLKYFQLLIAPVDVTGDYDFNSIPVATWHDWVAWTGLLVVAVMIVGAFWIRKKQPALAFAGLFFFITMLPTSNWIMPTSIIMSERALYLPSLSVCLMAGLIWTRLRQPQVRTLLAVGALATAALLCIAHNYVWRDELTYYGNLVRVLPNNVRGRQGYGVALIEAGRPQDALTQFDEGLKIKRNAPLLVGLSEALIQLDRGCGRARSVLQEALQVQAGDPFARWLLGGCFEREGQMREAEAEYRLAVRNTDFPDPKLLADWGRVLEKTGRSLEAQDAYRRSSLLR
jgi:protein O-mannosyl-transferase